MMGQRTWDPAPVLACTDPTLSDDENAVRLGVKPGTLRAWRDGRRRIGSATADQVALELGRHPVNLWPTWPDPEAADVA